VIPKRIQRGEPGGFRPLVEYIAAAKDPGEKLDDLWIVNSNFGESIDDLNAAIREIEGQQGLNPRVKTDKQYHLVVSFRDEHPSPEALRDIEQNFAKALGFEDHPRVVATHTNTDNFHMHVAYSRIHPKTLKAHSPSHDYGALEKISRLMETKHGLQVDLGREDKIEADRKPEAARDMEAHTWEQSFHGYVQEHKDRLLKARSKAKNWQDLHKAFAKYDLTLKRRGNGFVIQNGTGNKHMKASALDRSFSKPALEKEFGPYQHPDKAQERVKPVNTYKRRPITRHKGQGHLWRKYMGVRRNKQTLTGKAFKTWRDFLTLGVIDDPLAMAIIYAQRKLIETMTFQNMRPSIATPKFKTPLAPQLPASKDAQVDPERVYLDVPFEDKDLVKELGAKWDRAGKSWYVPDGSDPNTFKTWVQNHEASLDHMEVNTDTAERMGAFQETALSVDDVLDSHSELDVDDHGSPSNPPASDKNKAVDRDREPSQDR